MRAAADRCGRWVGLLTIALLCLAATPSHASWLEVHGDSAASEVSFQWIPVDTWPQHVAAIDILRAPCDAEGKRTGPWSRTTLKPIKPTVSVERVWADVHHAEIAQSLFRASLMSAIATDALKLKDDVALMTFLTTMSGESINSLRGNLLHQENVVWMLGFGSVRARPLEQAGQLYGFFEVSASGQRANEPLETFHDIYVPDDDPRLAVTPTFSYAHPSGIRLSWTFPAALYEDLDLRPFGVSREVIGPDGQSEVLPLGHTLIKRVDDMLECTFYDQRADRDAPHTYQVTTRSFVARDRKTTRTSYEPERARDEAARQLPLTSPAITETKQLERGEVAVSWEFEMAHEAYIEGFELHRRESARAPFVPIRSGLSPTARHTIDTSEKKVGETYSYKVVALRKDDKAPYSSQIVPVLISDMRAPPAPRDLKVTIEVSEGKRVALLSWAPAADNDPLTHKWLIGADATNPGEVIRQAGIEPLSAPSYRYPIETIEARPYTFQVTAISKASIESDPVSITVDAPGKYLTSVVFERFELVDSGRALTLHWRYPTQDDLIGFALYIDGEAQDTLLSPEARRWKSGRLERGSNHRFNVQAVSKGGLRSYLGKDWAYRMPAGAGLPIKPTKLSVLAEPAHDQLRVRWARIADGLTHVYALRVKPPGKAWRDAGTVKGSAPPVYIQRRADAPGVWEFEVRGKTVHGLLGPESTVSHEVLAKPDARVEVSPPPEETPHAPEPETPWLLWSLVGLGLIGGAGLWWMRQKP